MFSANLSSISTINYPMLPGADMLYLTANLVLIFSFINDEIITFWPIMSFEWRPVPFWCQALRTVFMLNTLWSLVSVILNKILYFLLMTNITYIHIKQNKNVSFMRNCFSKFCIITWKLRGNTLKWENILFDFQLVANKVGYNLYVKQKATKKINKRCY